MEKIWHDINSTPAVRTAVIAAFVMLSVFLVVESISTVTGEGTATAIPDTATISFGVTATAADVATAQAKVTSTINTALASVQSSGVTTDDITTTSFNVSPHYTSPACPPGVYYCPATNQTISGYDVSENVDVKIHDTTKVSGILAGLAKANVTDITGPDFVVNDTQTVEAQARGIAIQKAQQDAQTLAAQLHVRLGKIVSYTDDSGNGNPEPMMAKASGIMTTSDATAPSVPVGNNTYTKDVSVTYEIF
jgi:uncharacterized protein YggE